MNEMHFNREEAKCKCGNCDFDTMDYGLVQALEDVREHFDKPVVINSWCRCAEHNEAQGGSKTSKHLLGQAVDFFVIDVHEDKVVEYLESSYPDNCGIGRYDGRTHFDIREHKARWDSRSA